MTDEYNEQDAIVDVAETTQPAQPTAPQPPELSVAATLLRKTLENPKVQEQTEQLVAYIVAQMEKNAERGDMRYVCDDLPLRMELEIKEGGLPCAVKLAAIKTLRLMGFHAYETGTWYKSGISVDFIPPEWREFAVETT